MHALAQKLRLKKFKDGDTVFAEGDPFVHHYFVLSGRISCTNKRGDGMRNLVGKCLFRICVYARTGMVAHLWACSCGSASTLCEHI
jgi:CRP-like cAMP-binding protein